VTTAHDSRHLRVLVANEIPARLEELAELIARLGHDVVGRTHAIEEVGELTRSEAPDVALGGLGRSTEHALDLISRIVQEAACPVIAVLHDENHAFVSEAARRGIFAYVAKDDTVEFQSSIEIVLHRFSEFRNLEGAFGRRALIERAKGILMERHRVSERQAFDLLRRRSQETGRKLSEIARAVEESHRLLPSDAPPRR
jgi:response regulator NasT